MCAGQGHDLIGVLAEHRSGLICFAAVSGTEMQVNDGVLSGIVTRYFDEHDKVRFVENWCVQNGFR